MRIEAYVGLDPNGREVVRVLREASLMLKRYYSLDIEVDVMEVPVDSVESRRSGLPIIRINGETVFEGRVPSIAEVIDAVFSAIERASIIEYGMPTFEVVDELV